MQTRNLRGARDLTPPRRYLGVAVSLLVSVAAGCSEAAAEADSDGDMPVQMLPVASEPAWVSTACAADVLEPNPSRTKAVDAPRGVTSGLTLCNGDEDWFRIVVPAGTIVRVGIELQNSAGDLDLVAYDHAGRLLGSRLGDVYPYAHRGQETNREYYGFYSEHGGAEYFVRVVGYANAQNRYRLHVDSFPYRDGASCAGQGFTFDECVGQAPGGAGLLPWPFPDPDDSVVGAGYRSETYSNYRFARRELIMLVRHALSRTLSAFPGTAPLSLLDTCQIDGITPGYDVGSPRHPESTHDQGGNIDIAYFQRDGANDGEIICGDGSEHADGYCSPTAAQKHIVDLERQAFFMAQLFASPRTRVVGVDRVIAPLLADAAAALHALPEGDPRKISSADLAGFEHRMAYGEGWPYHHHHIHLSMQWWAKKATSTAATVEPVRPSIQRSPALSAEQHMTWPPRP